MATIAECALHLCVAERSFHSLVAKGVISRQVPGRYDLDTIRREYITHLEQRAEEQKAKQGDQAFRTEKVRLLSSQADLVEMQNADMRKRMLPRDDVRVAVTSAFDRVRQRIGRIPVTLGPALAAAGAPSNAQQILAAGIDDALEELNRAQIPGVTNRSREG